MVDAYEVLNADGTVAEPLLDLANPYTATKTPNYNQKALDLGYDPDDPYAAPRDPRMEACIIRNGDKILWGGELRTVETFVGGENGVNDDTSENRFTRPMSMLPTTRSMRRPGSSSGWRRSSSIWPKPPPRPGSWTLPRRR